MIDERRMPIMNEVHDIMSTKEKQATPKAAFVFLVRAASGQPAKQAEKRGARVRERDKERKTSDAEGAVLRMARVNSNVFLVRAASGQPAKQARERGAQVRERW